MPKKLWQPWPAGVMRQEGYKGMRLEMIKESPLVRPLLPFLRKSRRHLWALKNSPALWLEKKHSQRWSRSHNAEHFEAIEKALQAVEKSGGHFEGWALSSAALRAFTQYLCHPPQGKGPDRPCIVEFGSGQSTYFWGALLAQKVSLEVHTYEHHPYWAEQADLKSQHRVHIHHTPLVQVTDSMKQKMFSQPEHAYRLFHREGVLLPESEWENTRAPNTFYLTDFEKDFAKEAIHGVILDGPNGSGRSLVFSWIMPYLAPNALVLIDDYDHYPFLDDLARLRDYEMIHVSHKLGKRWCLLRLV
jgi:hypothetical protein